MFSDKVEAQEFARKVLINHLKKDRLSHTYLFVGKRGAGKEDLALAFAAALNSDSEDYFEVEDEIVTKKIRERNHPDVFVVGDDEKARSIKIEEVRGVLKSVSLKPYEGKWKVYIFKKAERLTLDAANALLKTLEEPPPQTLFVLLVENKAHLLETIQSRSFEVRLRPLGTDEEHERISQEELLGLEDAEWDLFLERFEKSTRQELINVLDVLMVWVRDQIAKNSETAGANLEAYLKAIDAIAETKEAVRSNVNQKLALTRLAMHLKRWMPKEGMAV